MDFYIIENEKGQFLYRNNINDTFCFKEEDDKDDKLQAWFSEKQARIFGNELLKTEKYQIRKVVVDEQGQGLVKMDF